jgi:hypothetical protein
VSVTLSAISYLSVHSGLGFSTSGSPPSFTAEPAWPGGPSIAQLFSAPDPGALVATTVDPIANGSTRRGTAIDLRVAFGSKYAADGRSDSFWQATVVPLEPHAWIWSGNAAYFDSSLLNCLHVDNAGHPQCACMEGMSRATPSPLCDGVSVETAAVRVGSLAVSGYGAYIDYACNGYFSAADGFPPGTYTDICPKPILGIYGVHDAFGRLEDGSFRQKKEIKEVKNHSSSP